MMRQRVPLQNTIQAHKCQENSSPYVATPNGNYETQKSSNQIQINVDADADYNISVSFNFFLYDNIQFNAFGVFIQLIYQILIEKLINNWVWNLKHKRRAFDQLLSINLRHWSKTILFYADDEFSIPKRERKKVLNGTGCALKLIWKVSSIDLRSNTGKINHYNLNSTWHACTHSHTRTHTRAFMLMTSFETMYCPTCVFYVVEQIL